MLSWNLKLRKLFGSRTKRPTARKPRKTVRLRLEPLEDRLQPSADTLSPPQVENVAAQMASQVDQRIELIEIVAAQIASMVQQGIQRIETAEQNLVNFWSTVIDKYLQAVSTSVQEFDHIFGIPTSPSGSGSGSGSGAITPTYTPPNQSLKPIAQHSGSGLGSGATTSHDNPSKPAGVAHPMGSGSGSGGGQAGSNDILVWNPKDPVDPKDSSRPDNRYDQTQGKQGVIAPSETNPVIFDGTANSQTSQNAPINWAAGAAVGSIRLQNGYNKLMSIVAQSMADDAGSFNEDSSSTLYLDFGSNSVFYIDKGGTITNMTLAGDPTGALDIWGDTMEIGTNSGYKDLLGANLGISPGAKLIEYSNSPLKFNNINLTLQVVSQPIRRL